MAIKVPVRPTPALSEHDGEEQRVRNLASFMLDVCDSSFEREIWRLNSSSMK